jgi:hypothetical protein
MDCNGQKATVRGLQVCRDEPREAPRCLADCADTSRGRVWHGQSSRCESLVDKLSPLQSLFWRSDKHEIEGAGRGAAGTRIERSI